MAAKQILVLDDDPYRLEVFAEVLAPCGIAGTDFVPDFVDRAARGGWAMLLLDYDLSADGHGPTGMDAARALGDPEGAAFRACCFVPVVIHSLNLERAPELMQALWAWEAPVIRLPFHRVPEYAQWLMMLL